MNGRRDDADFIGRMVSRGADTQAGPPGGDGREKYCRDIASCIENETGGPNGSELLANQNGADWKRRTGLSRRHELIEQPDIGSKPPLAIPELRATMQSGGGGRAPDRCHIDRRREGMSKRETAEYFLLLGTAKHQHAARGAKAFPERRGNNCPIPKPIR